MTMKVWVLMITHKHGVNVYVNKTEKGSKDELLGYVKEEWDSEMPDQHGKFEDHKDAVDLYFKVMGEALFREAFYDQEKYLVSS